MFYAYSVFMISQHAYEYFGGKNEQKYVDKAHSFCKRFCCNVIEIKDNREYRVEFIKDLKDNLNQNDVKWILENEEFTRKKFNYQTNARDSFLDDLRKQD